MANRFFVPQVGDGDEVELTGPEAHHLLHVRRARPGDCVQLFDGTGVVYQARVSRVHRRSALLELLGRRTASLEPELSVTLACSVPAGERLRWLVEKATELGVKRLVPLITARTTAAARSASPSKMRRWVIEACKQCGRNVLMQVGEPTGWEQFAAAAGADLRLVAHQQGSRLAHLRPRPPARHVAIAVGPEGGWTEQELELAKRCKWAPVCLGPFTLRVETAALALAACMLAEAAQDTGPAAPAP